MSCDCVCDVPWPSSSLQLMNTLFTSLSSLGNVAIVLVMIYFVYSVGECGAGYCSHLVPPAHPCLLPTAWAVSCVAPCSWHELVRSGEARTVHQRQRQLLHIFPQHAHSVPVSYSDALHRASPGADTGRACSAFACRGYHCRVAHNSSPPLPSGAPPERTSMA